MSRTSARPTLKISGPLIHSLYAGFRPGLTKVPIMFSTPFTAAHVVISLVGIGSGIIVVYGRIAGKRLDTWTAIFLVSTVAISVTGFFFPFERYCHPMQSAGGLTHWP